MKKNIPSPATLTRRTFVQTCALGTLALAAQRVLHASDDVPSRRPGSGPARRILPLNGDWRFGGKYNPAATAPAFDDTAFERITVPHAVAKLSWQGWDPAAWQDQWIYRRHFTVPPELRGLRVFLQFDGVMVGTMPVINGHELPVHLGGYLPARYELTGHLVAGENVLAVVVDSRWSNVPPEGAAVGAKRVDYLEVGGIYRPVRLEFMPSVYVRDVFPKPVKVLDAGRHVVVTCAIDAATVPARPASVQVEMRREGRTVARAQQPLAISTVGEQQVTLTLESLGNVALWDLATPNLYEIVTTLSLEGQSVHDHRVRTGLREARFELDGFFLNGRRLQLFGLNRHEIYPYVGGAMPPRVLRRDAEILRRDFNCNIVRCSHYPQSETFLDACDELGLMVWEETPGWGYLGDAAWKELLVRDVHDMIMRDRHRPAIVIWGTRANETANDVELYRRTKQLAKSLDDSRPTSGSMTSGSRKTWEKDWHEDVFAYDDYHADPDGTVGILDPTPGVPYLLAEAVGQFNYSRGKDFDAKYRRAGDPVLLQQQAVRHAQAHDKAAANPRICGVIGWCGFDYGSMVNSYQNLKCPGVADIFRIPKLGAAFYLTQGDASTRPVIEPSFLWDFGPATPRGPGKQVAIFSNCTRLELFIDGRRHATLEPDVKRYPRLRHAPFFADLEFDGGGRPELRIDGFVGGKKVASRSFSADTSRDQLSIAIDDPELTGDGIDATRLVFKVVDKFGAERAGGDGDVTFDVTGPAQIVGDNPFSLAPAGGVGAVWVKTTPNGSGRVAITVRHSRLGTKTATVTVRAAGSA